LSYAPAATTPTIGSLSPSSGTVAVITTRAIGHFVRGERAASNRRILEIIFGSAIRRVGDVRAAVRTKAVAHYIEATGDWLALRNCESGNNYHEDSGNGYFGAYQFLPSTWASIGYAGLPSNASPQVQDAAAEALQARVGWSAWPVCSAVLGLH
jgi:hypothetical protein